MVLILLGGGKLRDKSQLIPFDKNNTLPLRGLFAILIVAHHLGQLSHIPFLSSFCQGIGLQIVAVFFFLSGYGLCVSYRKRGSSYVDNFLSHRLGKLLPPFVILTGISMLGLYYYNSHTIGMQLDSFVHKGHTPLPNSWFIYVISYAYITFFISARIGKTLGCVGILHLIFSIIYVSFMYCFTQFGTYWWWTILAINVGYCVALYESEIEKFILKNRLLSYSLIIFTLFLSFCAACKITQMANTFSIIWILVQTFSIYVIIRTFGMVKWNWLLFVGNISLEIYLIHGIPLKILENLGFQEAGLWITTFIISIFGAYLINRACIYFNVRLRYLSDNSKNLS